MSCFFIAGTDTNVGKTVASRAIIQALQMRNIQIVGYKPIACNQLKTSTMNLDEKSTLTDPLENNPDVITLMNSTNESVSYRDVNSYTFIDSLPALSRSNNKIDIQHINQHLARLNKSYQSVLVEGAFGWLTPINKEISFADWVKFHNMPVVLVVGIKEGCINHTLLTAQSISQGNIPLVGWIANRVNPCFGHYAELIELLSEKIDAPLLGEIPYVYKPEKQDLGKYITNIDRLTFMQTI
ncbi:dethiobiotin synthase [Bisgaardia hudsonensis]|uniref:ATP-dependent dethiobiotin synthetase BioD n=1 Tax=Bisgaardia hudsonensis TaxID=109472 RepID=A0A4R2N193_9PAST|nr:dethiobiotin synthase [Bisgaardia hudsonensis]QLB13143.1 dethiobiotin synthase [Bisgaardia hudsonensis]TCP13286.1 dethiobiotin synthase [Bisgaardia hudsonensis]